MLNCGRNWEISEVAGLHDELFAAKQKVAELKSLVDKLQEEKDRLRSRHQTLFRHKQVDSYAPKYRHS